MNSLPKYPKPSSKVLMLIKNKEFATKHENFKRAHDLTKEIEKQK